MTEMKIRPLQPGLKKICIHWTAGTYALNDVDRLHYHYTVGPDSKISSGKFPPEANIPPLRNGFYTAHCGGGNSWCIGVALRGMAGYVGPGKVGPYPIIKPQAEAAWALVARLCKEHGIPVTPEAVFTHYEFGRRNPESDSAGKIDITHLPYAPEIGPDDVGEHIRGKVRWYLSKLNNTMPGGNNP